MAFQDMTDNYMSIGTLDIKLCFLNPVKKAPIKFHAFKRFYHIGKQRDAIRSRVKTRRKYAESVQIQPTVATSILTAWLVISTLFFSIYGSECLLTRTKFLLTLALGWEPSNM